jgi:hypothetical protein
VGSPGLQTEPAFHENTNSSRFPPHRSSNPEIVKNRSAMQCGEPADIIE